MPEEKVLYLLADYDLYKQGKIEILSAKSSVLISREHIKKIKEFIEKEKESKKKVLDLLAKLRADLRKFSDSLPKAKEVISEEEIRAPVNVKIKKDSGKINKIVQRDEIREELEAIEQKLADLGAV